MQVTPGALGQESVKQDRFICELCKLLFYHATVIVSQYEEHDKMLHRCWYGFIILYMCAYLDFHTEVDINHSPNRIALLSWKEKEEKMTYTCFVKPNGEVICDSGG